MQNPIAIFSTGRTFPSLSSSLGDFDDWISAGLGRGPKFRVDVCGGEALPPPAVLAGVVITGSHDMVTDRTLWSEALAVWLRGAVALRLPVLGICYGHQLLGHALGGETGPRVQGIEFGTVPINLHPEAGSDRLFAGMPRRFAAHVVHQQSVLHLPAGAQILASNAADPHQAVRFAPNCWGVQFHPEFNRAVIEGYGHELSQTPDGPPNGEAPEASSLLERFAGLCHEVFEPEAV